MLEFLLIVLIGAVCLAFIVGAVYALAMIVFAPFYAIYRMFKPLPKEPNDVGDARQAQSQP